MRILNYRLSAAFQLQLRRSAAKAFLLLSIIFSSTLVLGQSSVTTAGGSVSTDNGTISYSVGYVFFADATGLAGTVIPGVQQPFEVTIVAGVDVLPNLKLVMEVYPNPVTDYLLLRSVVESGSESQMMYNLYSLSGELLQSAAIQVPSMQIPMRELLPGTFLMQVVSDGQVLKTFKIIKH